MGMMHLPMIIAIVEYFDKRRSLAMGIATCGAGIGPSAIVLLAKYLKNVTNWQNSHFAFGKYYYSSTMSPHYDLLHDFSRV